MTQRHSLLKRFAEGAYRLRNKRGDEAVAELTRLAGDYALRPAGEVTKNHRIHEAIDRFVSTPDNVNLARVVEEALWWSVTPEMTRRQAELAQKGHFGELTSIEEAYLARVTSRIGLATKFSQERLAAAVARSREAIHQVVTPWVPDPAYPNETRQEWKNRTFAERYGFRGNKPTFPDTRIVPEGQAEGVPTASYPAIQECDCTEVTVCPLHQSTMSDGRAVCIPFHPKSAIRAASDFSSAEVLTPSVDYYCARCGHRFRTPPAADVLGLDKPVEVLCSGCIACGGPDCIERRGCVPVWGDINPGDPAFIDDCVTCGGRIGWVDCPTGGWWSHKVHPTDNHDAVSDQPNHEPHGACPGWPPGQLE